MNMPIVQLLVLAGIAIFLILRLRSVLGTKDGFEKPPVPAPSTRDDTRRDFEVMALAQMKRTDPSFGVGDFLSGARGAYEMILMGFERGEIEQLEPFLDDDVYQTFQEVVASRKAQGLTIEAEFVGVRELSLVAASYDESSSMAEITVKYVGELTSVVKDANDEVIEGSPTAIKRQKDIWTYARQMNSGDPNWQLVATDE